MTRIALNTKLGTVVDTNLLNEKHDQLKTILQQLEEPIIRSASMLKDQKDALESKSDLSKDIALQSDHYRR